MSRRRLPLTDGDVGRQLDGDVSWMRPVIEDRRPSLRPVGNMAVLAGHYVHTGQLMSHTGSRAYTTRVLECHTRSPVVVFGSVPTTGRKFRAS